MKNFKVTYESTTDLLKWTTTVEAENSEEAIEKVSGKGKIICVVELE